METKEIHMNKEIKITEMICFKILLVLSFQLHVLAVHPIKHPVIKL